MQQMWIRLIGSHILKRAVGVFTLDRVRVSFSLSALSPALMFDHAGTDSRCDMEYNSTLLRDI